MKHRRWGLYALLMLCLFMPVVAQDDTPKTGCVQPDEIEAQATPEAISGAVPITPPNGKTVAVDIGVYVEQITDIDVNRNRYTLAGFMDLRWCDPRLAFVPEVAGREKFYIGEDARQELRTIWSPEVTFVNEVEPRQTETDELVIAQDGRVTHREKFSVELTTRYDLWKFPFDTQVLHAEIESFAWTDKSLVFHVEDEIIGFSDEFSIPEWTVKDVQESVTSRQEARDRDAFSELNIDIQVVRDPGFYLSKVIVPLMIIVAFTWIALWMPPTETNDRVQLSLTGVLTSVAYQFIISSNLPSFVYTSFIDSFLFWSFLSMVLVAVEALVISYLSHRSGEERARRVDNFLRVGLPASYFIGMLVLLLVYSQ